MGSKSDKAKQRILEQQQQADRARYDQSAQLASQQQQADREAMMQLANRYLDQQREDRGLQLNFMRELATPGQVEQRLETDTLDWLDRTTGKSGAFDISQLGLNHAGLYESAARRREADRTAQGARQFGSAYANPNLQAILKEQGNNQAAERFGAYQADAFDRKDAEMRNQANQLVANRTGRLSQLYGTSAGQQQSALSQLYGTTAGMQSNALSQLLSNSAGMATNSTNQYTSFRPRTAWDVLTPIVTAGIGGASTIATGGLSSLGRAGGVKLPNLKNNPIKFLTPNVPAGFVPGGGR